LAECKKHESLTYEINLPVGMGDLGQVDMIVVCCVFSVLTIGGLQSLKANTGVRLGNLISKCEPLSVII